MADKPKKRPVNTPASGMPASGMPASGIPAGGMGWGGAASGVPARAFDGSPPVHTGKSRKIAEYIDPVLDDLMTEIVRIAKDRTHAQQRAAIDSLLDRKYGKAPQHLTTEDVTPQTLDVSHLNAAELDELQSALATVRRLTTKPVTIDAD